MTLTLYDLLFLVAAGWMLWQGFLFLGDRERAWQQYVERQRSLGKKTDDLQRTDEWERVAMLQGIFYTVVGTIAVLITVV